VKILIISNSSSDFHLTDFFFFFPSETGFFTSGTGTGAGDGLRLGVSSNKLSRLKVDFFAGATFFESGAKRFEELAFEVAFEVEADPKKEVSVLTVAGLAVTLEATFEVPTLGLVSGIGDPFLMAGPSRDGAFVNFGFFDGAEQIWNQRKRWDLEERLVSQL